MRKDCSELQINRKLRRRPLLDQIRPHGLALQLPISLDMSFPSNGLMRASPDGPCNDVSGVDLSLRKADGDAADFLDRPADQWRWGLAAFDVVFRRFVFGGGVALA
jgi:hypothetical protein